MAAAKKGGLGRGLEALIADAAPIENVGAAKEQSGEHEDSTDRVRYIKTFDIMPNANQPRKTFDEEKIQELANSILEHTTHRSEKERQGIRDCCRRKALEGCD